jgi:hypothetical protein
VRYVGLQAHSDDHDLRFAIGSKYNALGELLGYGLLRVLLFRCLYRILRHLVYLSTCCAVIVTWWAWI